jgi:hypothetical protein
MFSTGPKGTVDHIEECTTSGVRWSPSARRADDLLSRCGSDILVRRNLSSKLSRARSPRPTRSRRRQNGFPRAAAREPGDHGARSNFPETRHRLHALSGCSCTRAASLTSCGRPPAIFTAWAGKPPADELTHRLGATHPEALASLLQVRQSARERLGAAVNEAALAPIPICPPGSLGTLAVEGTEVECIWATLMEEKRNTAEARRRVSFAFMGPAPGV